MFAYTHSCLFSRSDPSFPIFPHIYTPTNSSYTTVVRAYVRNLRFLSASTPLLVLVPTHLSHIQAAVICSKTHALQIRIRSGGHDYDGLSYISDVPFIILDMSEFRAITVDLANKAAWVQSGATLGELYYKIAEQSKVHAFPAGVCPTVGVGGHFSGGGYGNMMRKFGLATDNILDAQIVDAGGRALNRKDMGEDLFWAIRGGGGASFGVITSWKIELLLTLEQGGTDIIHKWQYVADQIHSGLFIRAVIMPSIKKKHSTIKIKFNALFLGTAQQLLKVMNSRFPEVGLGSGDCMEMSWIESVLFWANYGNGTSPQVLLDRQPGKVTKSEKKKSDYVQEPISKEGLEGIWRAMIQSKKKVTLTFNPYGGRMASIPEDETPFPHRSGNKFKIQYSVNWKEDSAEAMELNLASVRSLYGHMTRFVSKSPRGAYLNYRDVDLGVNGDGEDAKNWGEKYFKGNFERLVQVKSRVDPDNFFRYEQSIPTHRKHYSSVDAYIFSPPIETIVS
uniref:FAD-binding PCMH-type domain-containing protein n=1 Tax=Kalanchoe fedtschenkoi TaxID=63787 RepID=A0A7N0RE36_KALFE